MKKFLIIIFIMFSFFSCSITSDDGKEVYPSRELSTENVVTFEGCEYFVISNYYFYKTFTHKGNCKNPIHYKE